MLPTPDQIRSNYSTDLLQKLNCNYIVISFPVRSLSGKKKGMSFSYADKYEPIMNGVGKIIAKKEFVNELVYVIKNSQFSIPNSQ
jgi:16S rRNA (guanine(1405)-N(7))-methyltransferase